MGLFDILLGLGTGGGSELFGGGSSPLTKEQQAAKQQAALRNNPTYRRTASQAAAFQDFLPQYLKTIGDQTMPSELANLKAAQATSPGYQDIQNQQRQSQTANDVNIAGGSGRDLVKALDENARLVDPEYYKTRGTVSDRLQSLLAPGLSGGETEAINRSLNQQGASRGTSFTPSQTETVNNATTFGNAARSRLSSAIGQATAAMPAMRSGFDVGQISLGRPTTAGNQFMGTAAGQAGGLQGQIGQTANNLTAEKLGSKDTLDKIGQIAGIAGSLTSSL